MKVIAYKLRKVVPPRDDLFAAIRESKLSLKEGDVVTISSKVVSIGEGRCVPNDSEYPGKKESLMKQEADWYMKTPKTSRYHTYFTIAKGILIGSSGIDESNGDGHYILYPKDPFKSAQRLRTWFRKTYSIEKLAVIITDSASMPLRRGAVGIALAWDGIDPLTDYKHTRDLFGREIKFEMANIIDALAASAVLAMGEGDEQTPIAVISETKNISFKNRSPKLSEQLIVAPEDDVYASLIWKKGWKRSGKK